MTSEAAGGGLDVGLVTEGGALEYKVTEAPLVLKEEGNGFAIRLELLTLLIKGGPPFLDSRILAANLFRDSIGPRCSSFEKVINSAIAPTLSASSRHRIVA